MKFAGRIKYDYLPNTKRKPAPEILWQGLEDEILKVNLKWPNLATAHSAT